MSRIGKKPIQLPKGVEVKRVGNAVTVKGPKGTLSTQLITGIDVTIEKNVVQFIRNYAVTDKEKTQATLRIDLKYSPEGEPVIHGIERISRPGRRVYRNKQEIPRVLGGLGLAIVSTSKGVLAGHDAVKSGVGGEVLCQVW